MPVGIRIDVEVWVSILVLVAMWVGGLEKNEIIDMSVQVKVEVWVNLDNNSVYN